MASAWQTLEEAALTLGISSRTLHRRLARGEFETRMENGRREVLVVIPEPPTPSEMEASDTSADELAEVSDVSAMDETPSDTADTSDAAAGELSDQIQTT